MLFLLLHFPLNIGLVSVFLHQHCIKAHVDGTIYITNKPIPHIIEQHNHTIEKSKRSLLQFTVNSHLPFHNSYYGYTVPSEIHDDIGPLFKPWVVCSANNSVIRNAAKSGDFGRKGGMFKIPMEIQHSPSNWGLDRIDQRYLPLDGKFHYDSRQGHGVLVYVMDSGIQSNHTDFEDRVVHGCNTVYEEDSNDYAGHGTFVAGIIGGKTYGVSKRSTLVSVKVMDQNGEGRVTNVLEGMSYILNQYRNKKLPSVINLSLGGDYNEVLNWAVNYAVQQGIIVVVAAGNEKSNSCSVSPASASECISVGSVNDRDTVSDFSNQGECVSLFAPGESITSCWIHSVDASKSMSGTSFASPHVCGVVALWLAEDPLLTPEAIRQRLISGSTYNVIQGDLTSPNLLLFSNTDFQNSSPHSFNFFGYFEFLFLVNVIFILK